MVVKLHIEILWLTFDVRQDYPIREWAMRYDWPWFTDSKENWDMPPVTCVVQRRTAVSAGCVRSSD